MDVVTCVVIALDAEVRANVEAALKPHGLEARGIASLTELRAVVTSIPVGGILLELATSIKSSPLEKEASNELLGLFPFARFRLAGQEVSILGDEKSLEEFAQRCLRFKSRIVRRTHRESRYFAVYLSPDGQFEDAEKTVTINVGSGGCFAYSSREWKIGDRVWLRLHGEETVYSGSVCFMRSWGNNSAIPGIGLKFDVTPPWA
jgi:hypothetical protein